MIGNVAERRLSSIADVSRDWRKEKTAADALGTYDRHLLQHHQGILYSGRRRIAHKPAQHGAYLTYGVPANATNAEHGGSPDRVQIPT